MAQTPKGENIEDLFFEFLRVAQDIQPKVIIGENVKGLTIGEAKEYYHRIINEFDNIGYDVCSKVLNASLILPVDFTAIAFNDS